MPEAATFRKSAKPFTAMRTALDTAGAVPGQLSEGQPPVDLRIETGYQSNQWATYDEISVAEITLGQDGADDTCRLTVGSLSSETGRHFGEWMEILHTDRRVRVLAPWAPGDRRILFEGYPQPLTVSWTPKRQTVSVTCLSEGQERLRVGRNQQVMGRRMLWDPGAEFDFHVLENPTCHTVTALPCTFNAGGKPNRIVAPAPFMVGGRGQGNYALYLFTVDGAPLAAYWTYAQALRYLCYIYIHDAGLPISVAEFLADTDAIDTADPAPNHRDPFVRRLTARAMDVSVNGMHVEAAIAVLCERAGVHFHIPARSVVEGGQSLALKAEHWLRVYATVESTDDESNTPDARLMISPSVRDLPRQAPFAATSTQSPSEIALANAAQQTVLTIDPRVINRTRAVGAAIEYEVTLLMRPGWAPHPHLDNLHTADPCDKQIAIRFWEEEFEPEFDDTLDLPNRVPRSVYHGAHPDHHTVADVYRLWVFPDGVEYVGAGLGRDSETAPNDYAQALWREALYSPYLDAAARRLTWENAALGAGLSHNVVRYWVPRRRPMRNTIGRRNAAVMDTSPIVRVCFDGDSPETVLANGHWVEYAGQPTIDPDRAAIRFPEPNIWAAPPFLAEPEFGDKGDKAIQRYIEGRFYVSVTCTIRADERLTCSQAARNYTRRARESVIDYGHHRYVQRVQGAGNSHLYAQGEDADPAYRSRDDSQRMWAQAACDTERTSRARVSGDPEVFWLDVTWRPGDSVRGVSGLGLTFPTFPVLTAVRYVNAGGGWRTCLHLTDMRGSPEVGSE